MTAPNSPSTQASFVIENFAVLTTKLAADLADARRERDLQHDVAIAAYAEVRVLKPEVERLRIQNKDLREEIERLRRGDRGRS